ncbi:hypothetical protein KSS87_011615 [Heliosperma pusillum]|nr:hypothetical protein KSS87_019234 [Heliosperma pusillum]KAH9623800.1 hypothetical protein KSS87_011615 [Heliosperma pusillum]
MFGEENGTSQAQESGVRVVPVKLKWRPRHGPQLMRVDCEMVLKRVPVTDREMSSEEENEFLDAVSEEDEELGASDGSHEDEAEAEAESGEGEGESSGEDEEEEDEESDDNDENEDEEDEGRGFVIPKDDELEELEKEYRDLQNREEKLVHTLKRHKDEDVVKGQAIKSQKALWDKVLEIRIVLQNPYTKSNKLPQALLDNNPSIARAFEEGGPQSSLVSNGELEKMDVDHEWLQISQIQSRLASFRNKSVDKWQRKADNISDQVATYMRDPSKMIRGMQMRRETADVFGSAAQQVDSTIEEANPEGDPELLDDSELYHQMLNEFLESVNTSSSEATFYALKNKQPKKRKVVDRRASKSRKIRYNVHEKIVNFMAPQPMDIPEMAPKLFQNLFGLRTQKSSSAA